MIFPKWMKKTINKNNLSNDVRITVENHEKVYLKVYCSILLITNKYLLRE